MMVDLRRTVLLFLALGVAASASAQVSNQDADWQARTTAPGVFYHNTFEFNSTAELQNSNYGGGTSYPDRMILETGNTLSGKGAFKALIPKTSGEGTVGYRHTWNMPVGNTTKTVKKALYYQFAIYLPKYILDHRFLTDQSSVSHKFAIIQEPDASFGSGEVVITNAGFHWFASAYRLTSGGSADGFKVSVSGSPCKGGSPNYRMQNGIDAGPQSEGGQTDATSCDLFKRRYGPIRYDYEGTTNYGAGTLTAQGNPDREASVNGAAWVPDAWNVVEVYINYDTQTFKLWHAVYGQRPKLAHNYVGNADIGNRANNYTGAQLLPRLEQMQPDPTRQDTYAIYDEVIASSEPIAFPGGFMPSNAPSGGSTSPPPPSSPPPPPPAEPTEPVPTTPTPVGAAPSWVGSQAAGTWAAIGSNKLSDLDPADNASNPSWLGNSGQRAVISAWNGGAFATKFGPKGSLIVWGGGHQDYYGNEIYAFDMDQRRWQRLTNPYNNVSFPVNDGIWADGTPSVPHTYGFSNYHPGSNSFITFRTQQSNSPSTSGIPMFFDFDTQKWRKLPEAPSNPTGSGGWSAYDASRDAYWMEGGTGSGPFAKFTPNADGTSGTWASYSLKSGGLDNRGARDPVNDIIVITAFRSGENMYGIDLKNPDASRVVLNQGGTPPGKSGAHGWEWSDVRKAFIYWSSGADVYEVKLSGSDWKTGTWVWTRLTTSANSVTPEKPHSTGAYNRFRLVRYDDAEVAVVVTGIGTPVYAFKIPGNATIIRPRPPTSLTVQ